MFFIVRAFFNVNYTDALADFPIHTLRITETGCL